MTRYNRTIVMAVATCLLAACSTPAQKRGETVSKSPVAVKVVKAQLTQETRSKKYVGTVHPSKSNVLTCPYPGTLVEMPVSRGQKVSRGAVIARIESRQVCSSYEMAEATLKQARDGYARAKEVHDSGSIADIKMVEVETQLAKAEAAYSAAKKALDDCTVKAPYSGVIGEIHAEVGVDLGISAPIVSIMDISSVEIRIPVPESEIGEIKTGAKASLEVPAIGKDKIPATVTSRGMTASPLSHSYECVLKPSGSSEGLMPGMVCKVNLLSGAMGEAVVIPASAIKTDIGGRYVWVVRDGKAVKLPIETGGFLGEGIIITGGVSTDDLIITEGSQKVSGGMKVRILATE